VQVGEKPAAAIAEYERSLKAIPNIKVDEDVMGYKK